MKVICIGSYLLYKKWKLTYESVEEWELKYPHRFSYKELFKATKGFQDKELLGKEGFGSVYKGVLPSTGMQVAIKRASNGSEQGIREFVAEVSSLGRLRHRNLVQLQGWCRRREDLLLVYDFMENGSLDSFLFYDQKRTLIWEERFKILKIHEYMLSKVPPSPTLCLKHAKPKKQLDVTEEATRNPAHAVVGTPAAERPNAELVDDRWLTCFAIGLTIAIMLLILKKYMTSTGLVHHRDEF